MNVVGLDLSLTGTGIATAEGTWTVVTAATDGPLEERLDHIVTFILRYASLGPLDDHLVVIEDFVTRSPGASLLAMVHGVVRHWLYVDIDGPIPVALVPPATLKKYATGKGNATKPDMRMALYQRVGIDLRDDNQVDAWWLRAMGLDHLDRAPVKLPAAQRAMLDKIAWPEGTS